LRESGSQTTLKSKRGLKRIGREYSAIAIVIVFLLLMSTYAFTPQAGGQPRVYSSVYTPITISAASLPIAPYDTAPQWRNMLSYTRNNLQSTTVVASWWDYGDWLGMLGNVTTLCDNTTTNTTQIENVAYAMMANEIQSLKMLSHYDTSYVLVFPVLQLQISSAGSLDGVKFAGYGDEGKWFWMARISGEAISRLMTNETFGTQWMTSQYSWTNETSFGNTTTDSTGAQTFQWNEMGLNSTIYKLMRDASSQWELRNGVSSTDQVADAPSFFTAEFISGMEIDPTTAYQQYGGLIPLVALYKIDWAAYYAATNSTATP
jgi:asparagine N-glycosylation enzyme membrane subunit Stt3